MVGSRGRHGDTTRTVVSIQFGPADQEIVWRLDCPLTSSADPCASSYVSILCSFTLRKKQFTWIHTIKFPCVSHLSIFLALHGGRDQEGCLDSRTNQTVWRLHSISSILLVYASSSAIMAFRIFFTVINSKNMSEPEDLIPLLVHRWENLFVDSRLCLC